MKGVFVGLSPYFSGRKGHDHPYHEALQAAAWSRGWRAMTLIPKSAEKEGLGSSWISHFREPKGRVRFFFIRAIDYYRAIPKGKAIVFAETYRVWDLMPLLIALFFCKNRSLRFLQVIRDGMESRRGKQRIHVLFAKLLRWKFKSRYQLFFDSVVAAKTFEPLLGFPASLLPIPHACDASNQSSRKNKDRIALYLPGSARGEKGVQEILRFCAKQDEALRHMELWIEEVKELLPVSSKIRCRWTPTGLPRQEYLKILSSADAILLPYDPIAYFSRTSGLFVEAICMGKMVFTKAGSWMAYELNQHSLPECILDWDHPRAPTLLLETLAQSDVQAKLIKMKEAYCRFHTIESFSSCIFKGV